MVTTLLAYFWVTAGITINPKQCGTSTVPLGATVPLSVWTCALPYTDGSVETIPTDLSWRTASGAITFNSIYTGEHYDARLEQKGWSTPEFDDSKWRGVAYRSVPSSNVTAQQVHPIRNVKISPPSLSAKWTRKHTSMISGKICPV